jgi:hypothetical protein
MQHHQTQIKDLTELWHHCLREGSREHCKMIKQQRLIKDQSLDPTISTTWDNPIISRKSWQIKFLKIFLTLMKNKI